MTTLAEALWTARTKGEVIEIGAADVPASIAAAYDVQAAMIELAGVERVGWKIGATTKATQELLAVAEPLFGPLFAPHCHPDGAQIPLPRADVVGLNRVLCCYPAVDALLENTLGATGSVYGFTAPIDRGPLGLLNRAITAVGNGWYRLRRRKFRGFRAFVHDLDAVDRRIRAAGFGPVRRERHGLWDLAVYARD